MYSGLRILAVVPARGGSKGVLRKNIRLMAGEPLINYTLKMAKRTALIDSLIVSTEDREIAQVSNRSGVNVIERPSELATDEASTELVLLHALDFLKETGLTFDIILVLEPTSPMRSVETIEKAIRLCADNNAESVLAVKESKENIGFLVQQKFMPIIPNAPRRRQLRDPFYIECSTIYAAKVDYLLKNKSLVCDHWFALVVPEKEALDINTEDDFKYIEYLILKERDEKK
jgi:CMP-N-acetylneuraminic acid synthetase